MGDPGETLMYRGLPVDLVEIGGAAKSQLHAKSVPMLYAGWCEEGVLGPSGGSVQGDQAVFCNALL